MKTDTTEDMNTQAGESASVSPSTNDPATTNATNEASSHSEGLGVPPDGQWPGGQSNDPTGGKPAKSKKKLLIAVVVIVIFAALAAVLYFLVLNKTNESKESSDPFAASTKFQSPQKLVDAVEPELRGAVMEVKSSTGVSAVDSNGNYAYGAPAYRATDAKFSVLPLELTGSAYKGDATASEKNYAALKQFFETNKFVKKYAAANAPGTTSDLSEAVNYVAYAEYESGSLLCAIRHVDASSTSLRAHIASIGCADKESYSKAAKTLQPFYQAYVSSGSTVSENLVFGFLRQTAGANGYKQATIYQEDDRQFNDGEEAKQLTGFYYQAPGKSEWSYFSVVTVDTLPMCADFKTDILKSAFKGNNCYDDVAKKYTVVQ